jgi:hypothetical protein
MEKTLYFIFFILYFYLIFDNYFEKKEMRKIIENQEETIKILQKNNKKLRENEIKCLKKLLGGVIKPKIKTIWKI